MGLDWLVAALGGGATGAAQGVGQMAQSAERQQAAAAQQAADAARFQQQLALQQRALTDRAQQWTAERTSAEQDRALALEAQGVIRPVAGALPGSLPTPPDGVDVTTPVPGATTGTPVLNAIGGATRAGARSGAQMGAQMGAPSGLPPAIATAAEASPVVAAIAGTGHRLVLGGQPYEVVPYADRQAAAQTERLQQLEREAQLRAKYAPWAPRTEQEAIAFYRATHPATAPNAMTGLTHQATVVNSQLTDTRRAMAAAEALATKLPQALTAADSTAAESAAQQIPGLRQRADSLRGALDQIGGAMATAGLPPGEAPAAAPRPTTPSRPSAASRPTITSAEYAKLRAMGHTDAAIRSAYTVQ